jgi:hypothetical protein
MVGGPVAPAAWWSACWADPDLPAELAEQLAGELPELLAGRLDDQVSWQIRVGCERFDLADEERIMGVARESRAREGWDLVVCLTDLPRRSGLRPILAEASLTDRVALASLPALGARRLYRRVRELVVGLVEELDQDCLAPPHGGRERPSARRPRLVTSVRRVVTADTGANVRFLLPGARGQVRLLAGMVRAALLHCANPARAEAATSARDQTTKASSSNATATRRFTGASTASS